MNAVMEAALNKVNIIWTAGTKLKRIYEQGTPPDILVDDKRDTRVKIATYFTIIGIVFTIECARRLGNLAYSA